MISKPFLYFIVIAVIVILGLSWWAGSYPARVTIINPDQRATNAVSSCSKLTVMS
jgi:hypothetical protein